jgi:death-on-curing protein
VKVITAPSGSSAYALEMADLLLIAREGTGQEVGVRDEGLLLSALDRPFAAMFGHEAYPTIFEKAAALLHSLARNHALVDGNKRTAWVACSVFLEANGWSVIADKQWIVDLVLSVATGDSGVSDIANELIKKAETNA